MPRRNLVWLASIGGVSLFCWAIAQGGVAPPHGPLQFVKGLPGYQEDYERLNLLLDVLQHVEQNYVHELDPKERRKFIEEAISGGLQSLDQHSSFMDTREFQSFQRTSAAKFGGVGIQIHAGRDSKKLTVISPIVGTPAYKAGIKPGDEIEKINGESTQGLSTSDAVDKIQGPPGTQITLTVRHRGASNTVDMTMTRSLIEVDSVLGDLRDGDKNWDFMVDKQSRIGYIRLAQFNKKSYDELKHALEKLEEQNVSGLVLDLRNNPGGLLDVAVEISDLFVSKGRIVAVEGRNKQSKSFDATSAGTVLLPPKQHPMAILINEGSASASEIVAAALQDHGRAVVVGERSFGKGSVQNLIAMENGKSAIKLTTAKYMRPSGKNIHRFPSSKEEDDWGVKPDMEVKMNIVEQIEWIRGRQDRDVVRDAGVPSEHAERLAAVTAPVWRIAPIGQPWDAIAAVAQSTSVIGSMPKDAQGNALDLIPKPYSDKVLDRALEYVREKLKS